MRKFIRSCSVVVGVLFLGSCTGIPSKEEGDAYFKANVVPAQDKYVECANGFAEKYIRSSDRPSEIAIAATASCGRELNKYREASADSLQFRLSENRPLQTAAFGASAAEDLKAHVQDLIVQKVIDFRGRNPSAK
jgi:hypothetical protein